MKVHQSPAVLCLSLAVGLSVASTYELLHQYIKILMCVSVTNRSWGLEGETCDLCTYCILCNERKWEFSGGTTLVTFIHINVLTQTQCLTETLPHKAVGESG